MERTNHAPSVLLLVATVLASCGGSASSDASAGHDGGTAGAGAAGAGAAGIGTGSGGTAGSASIDAGGGDADALTLVKLTFALPKKTYSLDSATFAIPAGNSVAVPCGGASLVQDCCNPPASASSVCSAQHSVKCDSSVCTVHQAVAVVQRMDFKLEVAALAGVGDQHLTDVSLSALDYAVDSNTLNVMVPTLEVYLAPTGVTTISDPA
ncbi:MAG: hypothetical protein JWM82_3260, partial [Myxococcales bacterium]|nr:hypothetical protein [Myxococcales bacterium]